MKKGKLERRGWPRLLLGVPFSQGFPGSSGSLSKLERAGAGSSALPAVTRGLSFKGTPLQGQLCHCHGLNLKKK